MELCTASMAKRMDSYTINELGVDSLELMERASAHIARALSDYLSPGKCATFFCGTGNNGGDGFGAAAILKKQGTDVAVFLAGSPEKFTPDTAVMAERLASLGVFIVNVDENTEIPENCAVIADAVFGFGFRIPLTGAALVAAKLMNGSGVPVVAADMPTGVEAGSGLADESAVMAAETVTFTRAKYGQSVTPGALFCGKVTVCDIGVSIPRDVSFSALSMSDDMIALPVRRPDSHKGEYGKVLIIAGSTGYTGAASFAAHAAVRSGAGLVFLGVPESVYQIEAIKNDEAIVFPLPCDSTGKLSFDALPEIENRLKSCDVCLVGPGIGISDDTFNIVYGIIRASRVPVIVDADGITALSRNIDVLDGAECPTILTPHDGEFSRFGDVFTSAGRINDAAAFSKAHGTILVLKGCRTISAFPDGTAFVNTTGNPGMAKGGSGDVLAGMMAALIPQLGDIRRAVYTAVYLHGKAGDVCRDKYGEYSMTPSDVIDAIKDVMR